MTDTNTQTLPPLTPLQKILAFCICFTPHIVIAVLFSRNNISQRFFFGYAFLFNVLALGVLVSFAFSMWCTFLSNVIARIVRSQQWDQTALGNALAFVFELIPGLSLIGGVIVLLFHFLEWSASRKETGNIIYWLYGFMTDGAYADTPILLALHFIISTAPAAALTLYLLHDQRKKTAEEEQQKEAEQQRQEVARQQPCCTIHVGMWLVDEHGNPIGGRKHIKLYDEIRMMPDGTFVGRDGERLYAIDQNGSVLQELPNE